MYSSLYNILICVIEKGKSTHARTYVHKYAYIYVKYLKKIIQEAKSMVPLMWVTWCWKTGMREYFSLYIFSYLVVKPFKWITYQKHFKQFVFPPFLNCLFIWFHHFAGGLLVFFILTLKKAPQSKKIVYFSIRYIADIFT